ATCWSCRSLHQIPTTPPSADLSAATSQPRTSSPDTGRTDDQEEDDPRRGVRVLRQAREPGAPGSCSAAEALEPDGDGAGAIPARDPRGGSPTRRSRRPL